MSYPSARIVSYQFGVFSFTKDIFRQKKYINHTISDHGRGCVQSVVSPLVTAVTAVLTDQFIPRNCLFSNNLWCCLHGAVYHRLPTFVLQFP
jgi:hypothetical protein